MPRKARSDYRGALHHVMVRGIERRAIFMDDVDRTRFLMRLDAALRAGGTECLAWALMPNHVHLLLRTGHRPLAVSMHMLGTTYAMDFNKRYDRVGHLFQNRYKALAVESDAYLLEVIRYIHLNPVRAGIVPDVETLVDHPWTGHRALMGRADMGFQSVREVLKLMAPDPAEARLRLAEWMKMTTLPDAKRRIGRRGRRSPSTVCLPDPSTDAPAGEGPPPKEEEPGPRDPRWIRANALRQEGWSLQKLTRAICDHLGVSPEDVSSGRRSRKVSEARAIIAWFAWSDLALSQTILAHHLGVGPSAVSARMEAGRGAARTKGIDPFASLLRPPSPWVAVGNLVSTDK